MKKLSSKSIINTIILSAGRGKRMRYKTKYKAKPLINIQEKPILERNLLYLSSKGIKNCVINISYKHKTLEKFIKEYSYRNKLPNIFISHEKKRLETGGGIKNALSYFNDKKILIINGDSLLLSNKSCCPITKLYKNFDSKKMDILLLLTPKKNSIGYIGYGDYNKNNSLLPSPIKRKNKNNKIGFVFTGWQIIKKSLLHSEDKKKFSLNVLFDKAQKNNSLYGLVYPEKFLHVSTPKSITEIESYLNICGKKL